MLTKNPNTNENNNNQNTVEFKAKELKKNKKIGTHISKLTKQNSHKMLY